MDYSFEYLLEKLDEKGYDRVMKNLFLNIHNLDFSVSDMHTYNMYELNVLHPLPKKVIKAKESFFKVERAKNLVNAHIEIDFSPYLSELPPFCRHRNVTNITKTLAFTPDYQIYARKTKNIITAFYEGYCEDCGKIVKGQVPDVYNIKWSISKEEANNF